MNPPQEDLSQVVEAARSALDFEAARAERLDAKARGQVTLAGAWFAVVQAVAAVALGAGTDVAWVIAIAVAAVAAGIGLIGTMSKSAKVWKLRPQPAIAQETLEDMTRAARTSPETFSEQLIQQYRHILGHVQEQNGLRAQALDDATGWWWAALGLGLAELTVALLARIVGG